MPDNSEAIAATRKKLGSAIKRILKKYGFELRTCGTKQERLDEDKFDSATGYWADAGTLSKPPRWIMRLAKDGDQISATLPNDHGSNRIGYFNLRGGNTGAILIRVVPAIRRENGTFDLYEDWEWSLLFCFAPPLRAGTSGDAIDINIENGTLRFQQEELPYASSVLIGLCNPDEEYELSANSHLTYGQATAALQSYLLIEPTKDPAIQAGDATEQGAEHA